MKFNNGEASISLKFNIGEASLERDLEIKILVSLSQVGACVVDDYGRVKAVGYNNMPNDDNDMYPWCKDDPDPLQHKRLYGKNIWRPVHIKTECERN